MLVMSAIAKRPQFENISFEKELFLMHKLSENAQWSRIGRRIEALSDSDMATFKRKEGQFIFATWSPSKFGMYYLKAMLALMARSLTDEDLRRLDKISNRDFGAPITIRIKGRDICLDYLQALHECKYIGDIGLRVERVLEIGAGYGRTAHALLSLFPNIKEYTIIDLAPCLGLSQRYLQRVLPPPLYSKLRFVLNTECENSFVSTGARPPTLALNCDSLGEMRPEASRSYLELISRYADYFYSCNPVAKYDPKCMEEVGFDPTIAKDALSAGLLTDVIDIFDDESVIGRIEPYISVMKPHPSWRIMGHKLAEIYTYYVHVMYSRK